MEKQRKVVLFLAKFFATYFLLFVGYSYYLQKTQKKEGGFSCSGITVKVANHTVKTLDIIGYKAKAIQHDKELSIKIILNDIYTARVIEGCNSISIIILFLAFIVAFKGSLKNTILFGIFGSLIIYFFNVIRIALLTVLLQEFPNQQMFLHNLVFPAIIYGITFLLWVVWVQKFSDYKK